MQSVAGRIAFLHVSLPDSLLLIVPLSVLLTLWLLGKLRVRKGEAIRTEVYLCVQQTVLKPSINMIPNMLDLRVRDIIE